ncbi:Mitogen-activated protein kinase [Podochytrium sp. JEL0797]|nr:Mitogen-activated protein kinase [Podochytrium sp. JEL0797]
MSFDPPPQQIWEPGFLGNRYEPKSDLGHGAYGVVCAALDRQTHQQVAIKKIFKVFEKAILSKRALREIKLLKHFNGHKNITGLLDMDISSTPARFNEIYLVQDLMEADLHQIVHSGQQLSDPHFQYFMYQLCRGLKFIHSANVLHRDLKPGNLLVNADCELKICDFGLARGIVPGTAGGVGNDEAPGFMTEYVATRWYRAPEIMLRSRSYTKAIDIWSVGCIFAELLGARPLFKGRDYVDQLNQIVNILGTPEDDEMLRRMASERSCAYIRGLPKKVRVPWAALFPDATPVALDFLDKLLQFDPEARLTIEQALAHPYLEQYHDLAHEPSHSQTFDFGFESLETPEEMKNAIVQEVIDFKNQRNAQLMMQQQQQQQGQPRPTHSLPVPSRDAVGHVEKDADAYIGSARSVDDELMELDQIKQ